MSNIAGDHGAEIRELLSHITRITVPARPDPDWTRIRELQRRLDGRGVMLQIEHRQRARLVKDRDWVETDIHGFERALVLVSGADDNITGAGTARLEHRLESTMARVSELTGEIDEVDARIRQTESEIVSTQRALVVLLRQSVDDAEEKIRAAKQARLQRQAQFKAAMVEFDEAPLWSPYAVMGYRIWILKKGGLFGAWHRWETPHMTATCSVGGDLPHTDGRCAEVAFGCGIYAAKSSRKLMKEILGGATSGFAVGLVGMEGKVVEHQRGYRAERATVLALAVVDRGVLQMTDHADDLETVFEEPTDESVHVAIRSPKAPDVPSMREAIVDYLEEHAQRRTTWTSANPNG